MVLIKAAEGSRWKSLPEIRYQYSVTSGNSGQLLLVDPLSPRDVAEIHTYPGRRGNRIAPVVITVSAFRRDQGEPIQGVIGMREYPPTQANIVIENALQQPGLTREVFEAEIVRAKGLVQKTGGILLVNLTMAPDRNALPLHATEEILLEHLGEPSRRQRYLYGQPGKEVPAQVRFYQVN